MDIYAEAHHTTAIFYQVIINLHQTLCTVAPKIPSFLCSPKFLWKAKKSWAWFGCSWAEVFYFILFFLVLSHPKFKVLKTQLITPPTFPSSREAKAFRKCRENNFFFLERTPRQGILGGLKEQLSLGWGRRPWASFCSAPKGAAAHLGLFFLGSPGPGRLRVCASVPFKLFRSVISSGPDFCDKKE